MKAIRTLIPFLTFALLAIVALSPLQNLWDANWATIKSWYPTLYLPAYVFVKLLFPALAFATALCFLEVNTRSIIAGAVVASMTGIAIGLFGIGNVLFVSLLLILLLSAWYARHQIMPLVTSLFMFSQQNIYKRLLWYLLFILVVAKIAFAFWAQNSSQGDAACRFIISHIWSHYYWGNAPIDKILNPNIDWLPIHFYITGTVWKLTGSEHIVLLLHTLADICGAFFLYKITRLFASKDISFLSCVCYLLYPANFFISAAIMSEPWFLLAVLATIYFFLRLNLTGNAKYFWGYAVAINMTCLIRYEGWPLVIMLPCIHFAYATFRFNRNQLILLLTLFAPVAIMALNYYQGFHPLRGILYSDQQVSFCYDKIGRTLAVLIKGYHSAWIPGGVLLALYAVLKHFRSSASLILYTVLIAAFSLPFIYKVATFSIMPDPRYLIFYEVLLIPLFVRGFFSLPLLEHIRSSFAKILCSLIILLLVSVGFSSVNLEDFQYPIGFDESVEFTQNLQEGRFIVDHHHGLKAYSWIAKSNLPIYPEKQHWYLKQFIDFKAVGKALDKQGNKRFVAYMVNDYESEFKSIDFASIDTILKKEGPVYLIIFPNGPLDRALHFNNADETYNGHKFNRVFESSGYRIYRLAE